MSEQLEMARCGTHAVSAVHVCSSLQRATQAPQVARSGYDVQVAHARGECSRRTDGYSGGRSRRWAAIAEKEAGGGTDDRWVQQGDVYVENIYIVVTRGWVKGPANGLRTKAETASASTTSLESLS